MSRKLDRPSHLAEHLIPIWDEFEGQISPRIGAAGLEALCVSVYRLRDAEARITADGMIVSDARGNPAAHPALAIEKQAQADIRQWMSKFTRRG